jgi:hypothetical protein
MFDGEIAAIEDEIVRTNAPVEHSCSGAKPFWATLDGAECLVKVHAQAWIQMICDEFKPFFGLQKMGCRMVHHGGQIMIKKSESLGHIGEVQWWQTPENLRALIRMFVFDRFIMNNDRVTINVLVLKNRKLLAIDEMAGLKFNKPVTNRFALPLRKQMYAEAQSFSPITLAEDSAKAITDDVICRTVARYAHLDEQKVLARRLRNSRDSILERVLIALRRLPRPT